MILAAGTVLVRKNTHWQVLIIHRHDRNDWSLPKGKAEVGENLAIAAVRETAEETGYQVQLRTPLTKVSYLHGNTQKSVNYKITQLRNFSQSMQMAQNLLAKSCVIGNKRYKSKLSSISTIRS